MQEAIYCLDGQETTGELQEGLHRCKTAIELRDVTMLLECCGISQHAPRQLLLSALRTLHENFNRTPAQRRSILGDTLLFQRLPEGRRTGFANALLELQQRFYLQRLIDLVDE